MNQMFNLACDRLHLSKRALARVVIRWFAHAPESVQQVVVGRVPTDMREIFRDKITAYFAEKLSGGGAGTPLPVSTDDSRMKLAAKSKGQKPGKSPDSASR